jgi:pyruvate dehydrogenase E2 component (dihydrolipoyllysine-residue acetyltransferase)
MPEFVRMPRLSDMMDEGAISRWLKAEGELVRKGEPLCEIEMDKATMVYESQLTGRVARHLCAEGDVAQVGQPIAEITLED